MHGKVDIQSDCLMIFAGMFCSGSVLAHTATSRIDSKAFAPCPMQTGLSQHSLRGESENNPIVGRVAIIVEDDAQLACLRINVRPG